MDQAFKNMPKKSWLKEEFLKKSKEREAILSMIFAKLPIKNKKKTLCTINPTRMLSFRIFQYPLKFP